MKKKRIKPMKNIFKINLVFVSSQIPTCPSKTSSIMMLKKTNAIKPAKDINALKNIFCKPMLTITRKTHTYNNASPIKDNEFDLVSSFNWLTLSFIKILYHFFKKILIFSENNDYY